VVVSANQKNKQKFEMTPMEQYPNSRNIILEKIRKSLGRKDGDLSQSRPNISSIVRTMSINDEIDLLVNEINNLSGNACRLNERAIPQALRDLISGEGIERAVLWDTPGLKDRKIGELLQTMGVSLSSPYASKSDMAMVDLGITEVDYAIAETGTLCLLSSKLKPRAVSLLPRVHLAILSKEALRPSLVDVFKEAHQQPYMVFITGPSRTADIELIVTLGVHGPKKLYVWVID
jgi:L-lactate dehydrogenase complex protein LldG